MIRDTTIRARIAVTVLRASDGIGSWQIAEAIGVTHYAVSKHITALLAASLPIGKTYASGPAVLWCPADRVAAVRARQDAEIAARRKAASGLKRTTDLEKYHRKPKVPRPLLSTRPPTKADPEMVRQRCVSAATAPRLRQKLGPASVFDLAGRL